MVGAVRIAEVIVGLPLGCCGLFVSLVSVIATIVACQRAFTGQSGNESGGKKRTSWLWL